MVVALFGEGVVIIGSSAARGFGVILRVYPERVLVRVVVAYGIRLLIAREADIIKLLLGRRYLA